MSSRPQPTQPPARLREAGDAPQAAHPQTASAAPSADQGLAGANRYDPSHASAASTDIPIAAAQSDENLLIQASQILQQMRERSGDVEQREQTVLAEETRQQQLASELDAQRDEISRNQQRLDQQSQTLQARAAELDQLQQRLDDQRMSMRAQVDRELEHERQVWTEKNTALEKQQEQLRQLDQDRRDEHQELLEQLQASFAADAEQQRQSIQVQLETEFTQRRRDVETRESELNIRLEEYEHERQQLQQQTADEQAKLAADREQQATELAQQRKQHETEILEQRRQFQEQTQQKSRQLKHEATLMENRHRFQADHLQTTRIELETQLRDFQTAQQQLRRHQEQSELMILLRNRQLEHYRELLEQREQSLEREHTLQGRARTVQQNELQYDVRKLTEDRSTWEQMQVAQQADVQRQHDLLNMHSQNLESRRQRLDRLRTELEVTHRDNLEIRMAIEETWSQLVQGAGQLEAKSRVDDSRKALSQHYDLLRTTLSQQRQELADAESQFQQQKDDFLQQRQATTECLAQRDETIRRREEQLRVSSEEFENRETGWREARDGWMQERIEAEHIIRGLLMQLTEFNNSTSNPAASAEPALDTGDDTRASETTD